MQNKFDAVRPPLKQHLKKPICGTNPISETAQNFGSSANRGFTVCI